MLIPIFVFAALFAVMFVWSFESYKETAKKEGKEPVSGVSVLIGSIILGWGILFIIMWLKVYDLFFFYLIILLFYTFVGAMIAFFWLKGKYDPRKNTDDEDSSEDIEEDN